MSSQENSFKCRKCGKIWSEESGATNKFVCEECDTMQDAKAEMEYDRMIETALDWWYGLGDAERTRFIVETYMKDKGLMED